MTDIVHPGEDPDKRKPSFWETRAGAVAFVAIMTVASTGSYAMRHFARLEGKPDGHWLIGGLVSGILAGVLVYPGIKLVYEARYLARRFGGSGRKAGRGKPGRREEFEPAPQGPDSNPEPVRDSHYRRTSLDRLKRLDFDDPFSWSRPPSAPGLTLFGAGLIPGGLLALAISARRSGAGGGTTGEFVLYVILGSLISAGFGAYLARGNPSAGAIAGAISAPVVAVLQCFLWFRLWDRWDETLGALGGIALGFFPVAIPLLLYHWLRMRDVLARRRR